MRPRKMCAQVGRHGAASWSRELAWQGTVPVGFTAVGATTEQSMPGDWGKKGVGGCQVRHYGRVGADTYQVRLGLTGLAREA
jgi:hypothetical protein